MHCSKDMATAVTPGTALIYSRNRTHIQAQLSLVIPGIAQPIYKPSTTSTLLVPQSGKPDCSQADCSAVCCAAKMHVCTAFWFCVLLVTDSNLDKSYMQVVKLLPLPLSPLMSSPLSFLADLSLRPSRARCHRFGVHHLPPEAASSISCRSRPCVSNAP